MKDDLLEVYWVAEMVFSMVDRKDGEKVDVMVEWMAESSDGKMVL